MRARRDEMARVPYRHDASGVLARGAEVCANAAHVR